MPDLDIAEYADHGMRTLERSDPALFELLAHEHERQTHTLAMIAAASVADPSVNACAGSVLGNTTAEGYPSARFHAGSGVVDQIERLAIDRATSAFGARYANVQPHSGSNANHAVLFSLLRPGDVLLGMELDAGGHLTHGAAGSVSGQYFRSVGYSTDPDGFIDYDRVEKIALEQCPKVIVCGASAYPREIDFIRFRAIADKVGAFLVADISHIAGLVVTGLHPNPVDVAHVTTTSTYKQLYGPRGGLILLGRDADTVVSGSGRTLAATMQSAVFPFLQGTPALNMIAAKARALALVARQEFRELAQRIISNAKVLADLLEQAGYHVATGGTDNHMVLVDVRRRGLTGLIAEQALESCGIIVNKNKVKDDPHGPRIGSGLRFGTNMLAARGMNDAAVARCVELVDRVLSSVRPDGIRRWELDDEVRIDVRSSVAQLCAEFPLPHLCIAESSA